MKFGGTSVADEAAIAKVVGIVQSTLDGSADRVVVVVSAMGGVTDLLHDGVMSAASGDAPRYHANASVLIDRHQRVASALLGSDAAAVMVDVAGMIDDYIRFCDSMRVLGEVTPRALDYTMGLGERMSARLVAGALCNAGVQARAVDATEAIVTDDNYQGAVPLMEESRHRTSAALGPLLDAGIVPVVTGFIGATREGISTTLGRGGSDYSAALLGSLLGSDEVWIWTDVDGVMSADPRIVPEARTIERLTYLEVGELAYFGAKVLHPKTIRPVLDAGIPVRVKNTFNPEGPGTLLLPNDQDTGKRIKAVTAIRHMSLVTVEGKGMLGVPGIAARTFGAVARTGTSVLIISQSSSEQSICFVVPQRSSAQVVAEINEEFEREIGRRDIDRVYAQDGVTIITVVGGGVRVLPGIAGRIFSATGELGVNVIAIAQGSSECSVSMVVAEADADAALRAIHPLTQEA